MLPQKANEQVNSEYSIDFNTFKDKKNEITQSRISQTVPPICMKKAQ